MLDLSVVIPVYNEEENLAPLWAELRPVVEGLGLDFEVVFVDDGSQDRSAEIVRRLREGDTRVRLVSLKANAGETAATDAGFKAARGRMVVTMDADLQNDPADIPPLLAELERSGATAVVGYRVNRRDGGWKRLQSRIANAVRNRLNGETIRDTGCSLKAFRADALRALPLFNGMHRFLPTLIKLHGGTVAEVPVRHRPRRLGLTKYGMWNRVFRSLADALAVRWMQRRALRYRVREELP